MSHKSHRPHPFQAQPTKNKAPRAVRRLASLASLALKACSLFTFHLIPFTIILLSCTPRPSADPLIDFYLPKARTLPETRIQDAYKYLYHATRGGEHAIAHGQLAAQWLETEWESTDSIPADPAQPIWEPLTPDATIGWLHLRPYKAAGGDRDQLLAAFLDGAQTFDVNPRAFKKSWKNLLRAISRNPVGHLTPSAWHQLDAQMRPKNYPPAHHSPAYTAAYHPAYRVLPASQALPLLSSTSNPREMSESQIP